MWDRTGTGALPEVVMEEFVAKEPLILFEIGSALSQDRVLPEAIEGWWENINPSNAEKRPLVLGKASGKIVGAYRQVPGSWRPRHDGRWGFDSVRADDVWDDYVGKTVPSRYLNQRTFQYL